MREILEQRFVWLASGMAFLCGLVTLRAGRAAGFIDDDIANLGYGKRYGFGSETFFGLAETRDHFLPGAAAVNKVISVTGPDWWAAQLLAAILVAALVIVVSLFVRAVTHSQAVALFAGFAVGASIVIGRIALWWTAASLQLPMLLAAVALLLLAVRWWDTRAPWLVGACVLLQVLAASFSDRAVLVPPLVWMVIVLLSGDDEVSLGRQLLSRTRESAALITGLFAVVLAQLALTLALAGPTAKPGFTAAGSLSAGRWLEVVANWWARGVAGVLTNDFPRPGFLDEGHVAIFQGQPGAVLLAGLVVMAVLIALTARSCRAAVAWGALVLLVTVSGVQIALGRVGSLGAVGIATIPRYQDITLLAFAVLVPLAWVASGRPRLPLRALSGSLVVAAICVAWLVQLRSGVREALERPMAAATYARNLSTSLEALGPESGSYTILDDRVPEYVMGRVPQTATFSWLSTAARVLAPDAHLPAFDRPDGTVLIAGADGAVVPVTERWTRQLPPRELGCVRTVRASRWLDGSRQVRVPVSQRATRSLRPIVLDVRLADSGRSGEIGVMPAPARVPLRTFPLLSRPGGFRMVLPAGTPEVAVDVWGGAATCFEQVSVSAVVPAAP